MPEAVVNDSQSLGSTGVSMAGSKEGEAPQLNGSTKLSTLEDLKEKAPKLYDQMLIAMGMSICRQMERHQARLKKIMREQRRG